MKKIKRCYIFLIVLTLLSIVPFLGTTINFYGFTTITLMMLCVILKFGKKQKKRSSLLFYSCILHIIGLTLVTIVTKIQMFSLLILPIYFNNYSLSFQLASWILKIVSVFYLLKFYNQQYGQLSRIINQTGTVTFKQAIYDYFLSFIDFKRRTTRLGYFWVGIFYVILLLSIRIFPKLALIVVLLLLVSFIPLTAIMVRRLRDVGLTDKRIMLFILIFLLIWVIALPSLLQLPLRVLTLIITLLPSNSIST